MTAAVMLPILGKPLSGKATVLSAIATVFETSVEERRYELEVPPPWRGVPVHLLSASIAYGGRSIDIWCMSGGTGSDWTTPLLPFNTPALLLFDIQRAAQDHQSRWWPVESQHVDTHQSLSILTKADLNPGFETLKPTQVLPTALLERPWILVSAISPQGRTAVQRFVLQHLSQLPQLPTSTLPARTSPIHPQKRGHLTRRCSGLASLAAELHFVRPRRNLIVRLRRQPRA